MKVKDSFPRTNFTNQQFPVRVQDARPTKADFTLNSHSFTFYKEEQINKKTVKAIKQQYKTIVTKKYYPIVKALLKRELGASRIVIFDHTYRKKDPVLAPTNNPNRREQPVTLVCR